ncbi:glycosyltransferase [Micromonospora sp. WMMA1363]|uniref:MGDG synthase family glycosyltransferase n=1 Tax=Micromonospora sp. WMMA1363 TaxID=3053985 RepID=UPI00259D1A6F|nr:glycosyltransferase [Micromonospora sp. WMMA1363]MDM4719432.1 glycosyltransferase [Micromonospora sp. WMMA1363]
MAGGSGRVVVLSADIGAGHDAAAAELTRRLTGYGLRVERLNVLSLLPGPLPTMTREAYRSLLRWFPLGYKALFALTGWSQSPARAIGAVLRPARQRLLARLPADTLAVVTTFPFANQLVGPLRRDGRLSAGVLTYVTDFALHPAWVAPGIDVYCVIHEAVRAQAEPLGARPVQVVDSLVAPPFVRSSRLSKAEARRRFGLPEKDRLALIVAGSWGVGQVERTAAEVLASGCVRPVVVCGRNEALRRRLRGYPGHVFGWVTDMPTLMRASDVVVENAGGLTCQESLAAGLPTVTYRPIPGHGRANAAILDRHGLTQYVATAAELPGALADVVEAGRSVVRAPTGADVAAMVARLVAPHPSAQRFDVASVGDRIRTDRSP